ncbi:AMP-binding protein [Xanthobacter agilis]|uniref:Long-subunit acyl-CoA synthetase (AMP-forming) n=1 Tax=Xanthobacter agilis TaxID=47492 RepID=A0ABU0LE14_XANAG|nr:AMP-binding protein [Xanthobacter agilis]MDQ0505333.1 long-subunit acyl-CoA synthetase (AMP-forming) [Xanthobacter agilis]
MRSFLEAVAGQARRDPHRVAFTDDKGVLTRAGLLGDAARLAATLPAAARVVGLLLPNRREWAVAQLACMATGRITVPLPPFFSTQQLDHVIRDAGVELVLWAADTGAAVPAGVAVQTVAVTNEEGPEPVMRDGFGTIIYTSGSTGRPKGVRHESGQLAWSARTLAEAIGAGEADSYLGVLPLSLLLESLCAVLVPLLVGGRTHFATAVSDAVVRGAPQGIAAVFAAHRPTISVMAPELLRVWAAELQGAGVRAPDSLRFVAAGGAPVPPRLAAAAWQLGIPVHEGYGLSECGSVVAMNRPGARAPGTVGRPLPGLSVTLRDGEILVDGPSVTDGYLGGAPAMRPWATGDLGAFDAEGRLVVFGRKDNLIVTANGRNISPEWVETSILDDPGIAACAVGTLAGRLAALIVPTPLAAVWFATADREAIAARIAGRCAGLPVYARPARVMVLGLPQARIAGLLTDNGRIRRGVARAVFAQPDAFPLLPSASPIESPVEP